MPFSIFDIAVVGNGITGLTAAGHAGRPGVDKEARPVLHVSDSELWGGLVANVGVLEGFSTPEPASGLDVALGLFAANEVADITAVTQSIIGIERADGHFKLRGSGDSWRAATVIAATGARLKALDVPGAAALAGRGVSQCAWCDGGLYRGAHVVVVGGGDAAFEEALHLAELASMVTILVRDAQPKARPAHVERARAHGRIAIRTGCTVEAVLGDAVVHAVRMRHRAKGVTETVPCMGVFVFIGLEPQSAWLGDLVRRDAHGAVITDADLATATLGLFAAGAVRSGYQGRLIHATAEAEAAVRAASRHRALQRQPE